MSKRMVHLYTTDERINRFAIGCMINPSLHVNKVFMEQVANFLNATFHENTMVPITYVMKNRNTCVLVLIILYEDKVTIPKQIDRVLSFVLYSLIDNYVCIDYLSCQ